MERSFGFTKYGSKTSQVVTVKWAGKKWRGNFSIFALATIVSYIHKLFK
jgi:hypothetical protein